MSGYLSSCGFSSGRAFSHSTQWILILLTVCVGGAVDVWGQARGEVSSGRIQGTVVIRGTDELSEEIYRGRILSTYQSHKSHRADSLRPYSLSEKAVIYIESVQGETTYTPPSIHPKLNQDGVMFRPLVLPVLVGTTVDFPNNDNIYHNVFSYSEVKEFDLGRYPKGQSRSVRFDTPGIVNVYCDIHSYMYATILVLENPYFALPAEDGSFVIPDVPPGTYRVSLWFGKKKVTTVTKSVSANETTIIQFSV